MNCFPDFLKEIRTEQNTIKIHTDTYLDSAAYSLLRLGYTLRLRTTSSGVLVTVKTLMLDDEALVHDRLELEGPVKARANPLLAKHWPKTIRKFIQKLIETEVDWQPLCTLQQTRHKRDVLASVAGIEPMLPVAPKIASRVFLWMPTFCRATSICDSMTATVNEFPDDT